MDAALAVVVGLISPLFFKYLPLKGAAMILATWVLSFALAVGDVYVTQGAKAFTAMMLAVTFAIVYSIQQVVYASLLKNAPAAVTAGPGAKP
jgi:hypothetical protein